MSADQLFSTADPRDAPNHVRATEIRCEVCGMPAGMCDGVPAEVVERMRRFIDAYGSVEGWTFAKTMADIPHAYAVRERAAKYDLEAWFVWFAQMIRQYGYKRRWSGRTLQYVNVDGWRYWTMGNPIDPTPGSKKTTILNRAPLTNAVVDAERHRREQAKAELDAKADAIMATVAESRMYAEDESASAEWDSDDSLLDRVMDEIASRGGRS